MKKIVFVFAVVAVLAVAQYAWAGSTTFGYTAGVGTTFAAPVNGSGQLGAPFGTICDGTALANCTAVKAASTAAVAADPSTVFQLSPNGLGGASGLPLFADITNSSIAVTGTFFQATQPVSAASLPLPSGAATSANQEVTAAGTSATSAQGVQGVTGGVALPISGTVTATPSGIFQTAPTTSANTAANPFFDNLSIGGASVSATNGEYANLLQGNAVLSATNPVFSELSDATHVNTIKAASTASVAGDTSIVVQINPSQPNLTTPLNVALAANQSVNLAQVAGGATSTSATGVQKVGVVGSAGATMDVAQGGATAATNALQIGGVYNTSLPTLTNGEGGAIQLDSSGRPIISPSSLTVAQGSTTSGQTGSLVMGATTTAPPNETTAQTNAVSLDLNGGLRVAPACNKVINISQTATTDVHTFTGFGYICAINLIGSAAMNIGVDEGTGTTCETSGTALIGVSSTSAATPNYPIAANGGFAMTSGTPFMRMQASADHLCVLQGTGTVAGTITYADLTN
jgi:hypothetical protein